jgi:hypothetical protein
MDRLQARALHKVVAFLAQFLRVEIGDVRVQYTQYGEPGPRPAANYLQGADAAVLNIRGIALQPQMTPDMPSAQGAEVDDSDGASVSSAAAAATALSGAALGGGQAAEEVSMLQALLSVPSLLWSSVVTSKPSASKLTMTGVTLSLRTYVSTWEGYQSAAAAQNPAPAPFVFTGSTAKAVRASPLHKRRRPASSSFATLESSSDSARPRQPLASEKASLGQPLKPASGQAARDAGGGGLIDYSQLLASVAAEEHVLFKQWEVTVMINLLPGRAAMAESITCSTAGGSDKSATGSVRSGAGASTPQAEASPNFLDTPESGSPSRTNDATALSAAVFGAPAEVTVMSPFAGSHKQGPNLENRPEVRGGVARGDAPDHERAGRFWPGVAGSDAGSTGRGSAPSSTGRGGAPPTPSKLTRAVGGSTSASQAPGAASVGDPPIAATSLLTVSVSLKALVPEFNAASLSALTRLLDRQLHWQNYATHWRSRPQVPVESHAAVWWQHAGSTLAARCGHVARRQVSLQQLSRRRKLRTEYQTLYAAAHVGRPGFQDPGARWWRRGSVAAATPEQLKRLQALEARLTAEEIAHFRCAVGKREAGKLWVHHDRKREQACAVLSLSLSTSVALMGVGGCLCRAAGWASRSPITRFWWLKTGLHGQWPTKSMRLVSRGSHALDDVKFGCPRRWWTPGVCLEL